MHEVTQKWQSMANRFGWQTTIWKTVASSDSFISCRGSDSQKLLHQAKPVAVTLGISKETVGYIIDVLAFCKVHLDTAQAVWQIES